MIGASVFLVLGLLAGWVSAQFLNNKPFPTYSLENMPDTQFSCRDKILGGYYADADTQCQMFHVCVKVAGVGVQDFRFLCPNGTAFDQDHQICADWEDVDCDATTLYYSSDNFDLYRIGSGLESKAVKYGEDEETFALQRAETGDARLNREQQVQRVNQQKESTYRHNKNIHSNRPQHNPNNNVNNNDRDLLKGASSSNFFNNRNGGKEPEDVDDESGPTNPNQDTDAGQKRKLNRKQHRRPQQNQNGDYQREREQNQQQPQEERENYPVNNRNNQKYQQQNFDARTSRPNRPAGFTNNFAGSSYTPSTTTTQQPTTVTETPEPFTKHFRRVGHRIRVNQYSQQNTESKPTTNGQTPAYTLSTPAPFRQTQQYNSINRQTTAFNNPSTTTQVPKTAQTYSTTQQKTVNTYPSTLPQQYDVQKTKQTDNYPTILQTTADTKPFTYETKKPTGFTKQTDNYPTTFAPKAKFFNQKVQYDSQKTTDALPTTFAPRTNAAYSQISQQTTQYQQQNTNKQYNQPTTQFKYQTTFNQQSDYQRPTGSQNTQTNSTPRTSPYTQYTPTVPKITTYASTTPVTRSNRYDETQYDDGSYSTKYDYDGGDRRDDELIKTAHSTNIASSRNEFAKYNKVVQQSTYQSPRPFAVTPTPKATTQAEVRTTNQQKPTEVTKKVEPLKKQGKEKNVSYDYAYYDTAGSELEYDIGTEIDKVTKKQ